MTYWTMLTYMENMLYKAKNTSFKVNMTTFILQHSLNPFRQAFL